MEISTIMSSTKFLRDFELEQLKILRRIFFEYNIISVKLNRITLPSVDGFTFENMVTVTSHRDLITGIIVEEVISFSDFCSRYSELSLIPIDLQIFDNLVHTHIKLTPALIEDLMTNTLYSAIKSLPRDNIRVFDAYFSRNNFRRIGFFLGEPDNSALAINDHRLIKLFLECITNDKQEVLISFHGASEASVSKYAYISDHYTAIKDSLDIVLPNWRSYFSPEAYPDLATTEKIVNKVLRIVYTIASFAANKHGSDNNFTFVSFVNPIGPDMLYLLICIIAVVNGYSLDPKELPTLNEIAKKYLA